jgi:hypothetical protein
MEYFSFELVLKIQMYKTLVAQSIKSLNTNIPWLNGTNSFNRASEPPKFPNSIFYVLRDYRRNVKESEKDAGAPLKNTCVVDTIMFDYE